MLYATASQTIGPYLHIGLDWLNTDKLAGEGVSGQRVTITGTVVNANGEPVSDGLIEIWQANAHGKYNHPADDQDKPIENGFLGFGRVPTDASGAFRFHTVKPGRVPGPDGELQAPHILVSLFARGILKRIATRIYFPDEPSNARDYVLNLVPAERRDTLIAKRVPGEDGALRFNIVLQGSSLGQDETVFFEC